MVNIAQALARQRTPYAARTANTSTPIKARDRQLCCRGQLNSCRRREIGGKPGTPNQRQRHRGNSDYPLPGPPRLGEGRGIVIVRGTRVGTPTDTSRRSRPQTPTREGLKTQPDYLKGSLDKIKNEKRHKTNNKEATLNS